jgi:hypothetical protein
MFPDTIPFTLYKNPFKINYAAGLLFCVLYFEYSSPAAFLKLFLCFVIDYQNLPNIIFFTKAPFKQKNCTFFLAEMQNFLYTLYYKKPFSAVYDQETMLPHSCSSYPADLFPAFSVN